jgi:hypothetical protein
MNKTLMIAMLAAACGAGLAQAQSPVVPPMYYIDFVEESGIYDGTGVEIDPETDTRPEPVMMWSTSCILDPVAPFSRIHFADWNLGSRSYVLLISDRDLQVQRFDARMLREWSGHSAYFNSGIVHIELWVDPTDRGVFVNTSGATFGEWVNGNPGGWPETICDTTDDRVASTEGRVARYGMGGCTHWMAANGAVLTAGHCTDFDPDRGGPQLPDGVIDFSGNIQINPPASLSNGTTQAAPVNDQYPMRPATALFRFDGEGQGLGKDYSVYLCGPNSNTGLRVHVAEGFYRLTDLTPTGGTIRITGYGSDSGVDNFTNQTESGPYAGLGSSGANIWHTYRADTEGGNSGSPIIWTANGFSTGIHTNGGCGNGGAGANSGTSFAHNALESALRNIVSSTAQFVDAASYPAGTSRNGRIFGPWTQVGDGASAVVSGGVVSIVEGTYLEIGVFGTGNKAMTWQAPVGTVVIGGN